MKRNLGWLAAAMAALVAAFAAVPTARAAERDDLLEEVRGLRRDLHAVAVVAQRIQLLVYRLHVQAEIARRSKERYEAAEHNADAAESGIARRYAEIASLEESIRAEANRDKKAGLERELAAAKTRQQEAATWVLEARAYAAGAEREHLAEQARLDDLLTRLDLLERQLEGLSASLRR